MLRRAVPCGCSADTRAGHDAGETPIEGQPNYSLESEAAGPRILAPDLPYRPRQVEAGEVTIGLIGCGGIAETHLTAYRRAGYHVLVLCDRTREKAERYRERFYPEARVTSDYRDVIDDPAVRFVDLTPYPDDRAPLIEESLLAGKHVLSQKPLTTDLAVGERLVELADRQGVKLAVNQNGRWAPHFSYAREAVRAGWLGQLTAIRQSVRWDHNWVRDLPFNDIHDLVLHDFGIHWFDFVVSLLGPKTVRRVYASVTHSPAQLARPPLLAQVVMDAPQCQVSLTFDADTRWSAWDQTTLIGTSGVLHSAGRDLNHQTLSMTIAEGVCRPSLEGQWFPDGFHGAMAELVWAAETGAEPLHGARENLSSLALCAAAIASARTGEPVVPVR
ncbi:MAG: Gfo/Idh/MocA family oxidoreductase [Pirellulales bacterium]